MRPVTRVKVIAVIVLGIIAAIIALQNLEPVATRLMFATVTMPRIVVLLIMLAIGFVLGIVLSLAWATRLLAAKREKHSSR
jgi:uncharacterized integral membrane protein